MAKRIHYKVGDIFLVPLEDNLNGVGRILKINQATVFMELYRIKPIVDISGFIYDEAVKEKPIVMTWCYDDALRKGIWEIKDNKPIEKEIDMPFFWTQDAGDKRYYIRKGEKDSHETYGERIEIAKEDINKYESYGIGNEISEKNRYIKRLRESGLM